LEEPTDALYRRGDKKREECGGSPRPGPLEKEEVEETALGGKGVRGSKWMGLRGEDGVGCVKIGRVPERVVGAVSDGCRCEDEGNDVDTGEHWEGMIGPMTRY